jgi:hypothetical protein
MKLFAINATTVLSLCLAFTYGVTKAADLIWLDGKISATGFITDDEGKRWATATMTVWDPGNPEPRLRTLVWLVVASGAGRKTQVELDTVGKAFKISIRTYRFVVDRGMGFFEVRYLDAKGKEKAEQHAVIQAVH